MTEAGQNLTIYQGEDLDVPVTLTDVTLVGGEAFSATFRDRASGTVVLTLTTANPDEVTVDVPGQVIVSLTSAQTAALRGTEAGTTATHDWALWRENDGKRVPYSLGLVTVIDTART